MRKILPFYLFGVLMAVNSCTHSGKPASALQEINTIDSLSHEEISLESASTDGSAPTIESKYPSLLGTYSGKFGNNSYLSITLRYFGSKNVVGYNIVKNQRRNISGTYSVDRENNIVSFDMREPGDELTDGVFHFTIDMANTVKGSWKPFIDSISPLKSFTLNRNELVNYTNDDGSFFAYELNHKKVDEENNYELSLDGNGTFIFYYYTDYANDNEQRKKISGSWAMYDSTLVLQMPMNDLFKTTEKKLDIIHTGKYGELELSAPDIKFSYDFAP